MSKKVGGIHIAIGLSTNAFSAGISKVSSMLSSTFAGVSSTFANITSVAKPLVLLGSVVGTGLLGWGAKTAIELESAEMSFTTLLKSSEKAKALMAGLQKEAAATPFETMDLVKSAKILLSFQVPLENIQGTISALGDIAAATGKPLDELALIFGQVKSAGRLMGGDFLQLAAAGVPMISALAREFKVGEDKVKALIESGQVGFPRFANALQSIVGTGGLFSGAMAKQAGTLSGLLSTLTDSVKNAATKISVLLIDAFDIKGKTARFSAWIDSLSEKTGGLKKYADGIAVAFNTAGDVALAVAGKAIEFFNPVWQGLDKIDLSAGNVRQTVLAVLESIGTGVATLWAYARDGAIALWDIAEPVLQAFCAGMLEIIDVVRELGAHLDVVGDFFRGFFHGVSVLFDRLMGGDATIDLHDIGRTNAKIDRTKERADAWNVIMQRGKEVFGKVTGQIASGATAEIQAVRGFFADLRKPVGPQIAPVVPMPTKPQIDGSQGGGFSSLETSQPKLSGAFSARSTEAYEILANAENAQKSQVTLLSEIKEAVKISNEYLRRIKMVPMLRADL